IRLRRVKSAALPAILGEGEGGLVADFGEGNSLESNVKACHVHHCEHRAHAFVWLAEKVSGCTFEFDDAGRRRVNAHLVLKARAVDLVALTIDELWNHECADALDSLWGIRKACEHKVDDVRRHVVFTEG